MRLLFAFEVEVEEEVGGPGKGMVWRYVRSVLQVATFDAQHQPVLNITPTVDVLGIAHLADEFVGRMSAPVRGTGIRVSVSAPDPQVEAAMKSFMNHHGPFSESKRYRFRVLGAPTILPEELSRNASK